MGFTCADWRNRHAGDQTNEERDNSCWRRTGTALLCQWISNTLHNVEKRSGHHRFVSLSKVLWYCAVFFRNVHFLQDIERFPLSIAWTGFLGNDKLYNKSLQRFCWWWTHRSVIRWSYEHQGELRKVLFWVIEPWVAGWLHSFIPK